MYSEAFIHDIEQHATIPAVARMLALFETLVEEDGLAPITPFMQALDTDLMADMAILKPEGEGDFIYLHYGADIAATAGFDMTGCRTSDFASEVGAFFVDIYRRTLRDRQPIFTVHRASHALNVHLWERLILPMRDADGGELLVALIKPREFMAELLRAVLAASADAIFGVRTIRDETGEPVDAMILCANDQAGRITGSRIEELEGQRLLQALPELVETGVWVRLVRVIEQRRSDRFEVHYEGNTMTGWFRVSAMPLGDGASVSFTDITELKDAIDRAEAARLAAEKALSEAEAARDISRYLATTDPLTGVFNRRGLEEHVCPHQATLSRYHTPFSVIALDLDHFKHVNDTHGHEAGDRVLKAIADILLAETRRDLDIVARIGGEEFIIVVPRMSMDRTIRLAERIRRRIETETFPIKGAKLRLTASFGVQEARSDQPFHITLRDADQALYEAKAQGRNRVIDRTPHHGMDHFFAYSADEMLRPMPY